MKKYRKAVFITTYRKEKNKILYLVLKRKLHWRGYEFPKGGIKKHENLIKAVARELKEETGQKPLKIIKFKTRGKYLYDKIYPDRKGIKGQSWKLFSAQIKSNKIKLDKKEHSGYKWLSLRDAVKKLKFKNQKKCLKIVNKKLARFK